MKNEKTPIELWADALESGKYQQTRGVLQRVKQADSLHPIGFCCLGVACEVAIQAGIELEVEVGQIAVGYNGRPCFLPDPVKDWFGFAYNDVIVKSGKYTGQTLTRLNDEGIPFTEIARIIREDGLEMKKEYEYDDDDK